jgi:hypothetical protein
MGFPQIRQLIITKRSDELNIGTWTMWLVSQLIFSLYVASKNDKVLMVMSVIWLAFYIVMAALVLYYRWRPGGTVPEETAPAVATEEL